MNYALFISYFPEFSTLSQISVENSILRSTLKSGGYPGICEEARRFYAIGLLAAHLLVMQTRTADSNQGRVKKIKSRNDEIEFLGNDLDFSLSQSVYGRELEELLATVYLGGFLV